jgi:hypothetical protein
VAEICPPIVTLLDWRVRGANLSAVPENLIPAFRLLFGATAPAPTSLDLGSLKRTYRRRALDTHPDRASATGADPATLTRRFQEVTAAYERLVDFVARGAPRAAAAQEPRGPSRRREEGAARPAKGVEPRGEPARPVDHHWGGRIPDHALLLGQYLYYTGRISFRTLVGAIVWQQRQRPYFGQLAIRAGYLVPEIVPRLLALKRFEERIGEAALRLGLMTERECDHLLGLQRRTQRPIGEFFVDRGLLRPEELARAVFGLTAHNLARRARCAR